MILLSCVLSVIMFIFAIGSIIVNVSNKGEQNEKY